MEEKKKIVMECLLHFFEYVTAKEVADRTGLSLYRVGAALRSLRDEELAESITVQTPQNRSAAMWRISVKGRAALSGTQKKPREKPENMDVPHICDICGMNIPRKTARHIHVEVNEEGELSLYLCKTCSADLKKTLERCQGADDVRRIIAGFKDRKEGKS